MKLEPRIILKLFLNFSDLEPQSNTYLHDTGTDFEFPMKDPAIGSRHAGDGGRRGTAAPHVFFLPYDVVLHVAYSIKE